MRFYDRERSVLVYVAYSDRELSGSPQNSLSSVPIMGWQAPRGAPDSRTGKIPAETRKGHRQPIPFVLDASNVTAMISELCLSCQGQGGVNHSRVYISDLNFLMPF